MKEQTALTIIASSFQAMKNCEQSNNLDWFKRHRETIEHVVSEVMPHGSGIDGEDIVLDMTASKPERLVFANLDFHHMDENGFYDGWSYHQAIITPSLVHGYNIRITGSDRDEIKDYLIDLMSEALSTRMHYAQDPDRPYISERYIGHAIEMFANKFRSYDRQS